MSAVTYTAGALAVIAQVYISPIPEVSTVKVVVAYFFASLAALSYLLISTHQRSYLATVLIDFLSINFTFLSTATLLTIVRRLYFSPLSKIPGPKIAAISKLWDANEFRLGRAALTHKKLFAEYGTDVVRIGPNEVCVNNVDAIAKIYKGKYIRGTFYEIGVINGEFSLNTTRDYKDHTPWRRIWEKAFVTNEFKDYNPRVEYQVSKLMERLKANQGTEINMTKLMDDLVFDVMADLMFSQDTKMQEGTGDGSYMEFLHKYVSVIAILGCLRNACQLLKYFPETVEVKAFRENGEKLLADRQRMGSARRDLFSHLLAEDTDTGCHFTQAQLNSNAQLAIVAGADTTSSTMIQTFRALARDPRVQAKAQAEIDALCAADGAATPLTVESTKSLPYVSAIVSEALRLYNPVPSGAPATTGPEGVEIAGVYLPGNCQVQIPHFTIMTDDRYFPRGEEFIPERWTGERPELILDRRVYIPFGYGAHSCVGKQLALNEMRLIIARVLRDFDVALGPSYDEKKYWEEWKDYFAVKMGTLELKLTARR